MSDDEVARGGAEEDPNTSGREDGEGTREKGKNHKKYRKDKPWDNASIDHWAIPEWKDENMKVIRETAGIAWGVDGILHVPILSPLC